MDNKFKSLYKFYKICYIEFEIESQNGQFEGEEYLDLDENRRVNFVLNVTTKFINFENKMIVQLEFNDIVNYKSFHLILISSNTSDLYFNLKKSTTNPLIYESEKNIPVKLYNKLDCGCNHSDSDDSDHHQSYHCNNQDQINVYNFKEIVCIYSFESSHIKKIISFLESNLKYDSKYSDLTIIVNEKVFKVHKLIISSKSSVFKKMIDTEMLEKQSNIINIKDTVNEEMFEEILNFIYLGKCNLSNDNVHEIFCFSHQYEIEDLQECCKKFMIKNISQIDKVDTLKLINIENFKLIELKNVFNNYIQENKDVVNDKSFIDYLVNNLSVDNIYYSYDLAIKFELDIIPIIKDFIIENLDKVMKNDNFLKLIRRNPDYMIEILQYMTMSKIFKKIENNKSIDDNQKLENDSKMEIS